MPRGRPRQFDEDAALTGAMMVFWEKGLAATSLDDLAQAMGMNRPSIYNAFGNKDAIYRTALARFCGQLDLAHALVNDPACFERVREPAVALLAELNAAGLCHGDLKATNFMVDDEGVVLIDFDALRYGSSAPDVHRFLANWEETPELRQAWQNALKGVGLA